MPLDKETIQDLEYSFEYLEQRIGLQDPMQIPTLSYLIDVLSK